MEFHAVKGQKRTTTTFGLVKWAGNAMGGSPIFSAAPNDQVGCRRRRSSPSPSRSCIIMCCFLILVLTLLRVLQFFVVNEELLLGAADHAATAATATTTTRSLATDEWILRLPCPGFEESISRPALFCANSAASRAPLHSLRVRPLLWNHGAAKPLTMGSAPPLCYSSNGDVVPQPSWARGLLMSLVKGGAYEAAQSLLREDPWYILIGWMTDKFMGPPRGGRAEGDIMFPAPRGKNASHYLVAYGSVWHTEVEVGNLRFHFQLVHRHAMVVCMRERIHLFKFYCLPDADVEPIPIHVCACRNCRVPTEEHDRKVPSPRMRERFPAFSEPRLLHLPETVRFNSTPRNAAVSVPPPRSDDACISAPEAPWLFNTTIVPAFPYEGKYNDLDALLRIQVDANNLVTVVVFNSFWVDHLHNFVYSFTRNANMHNLVVAALDDAALSQCLSFRLPCFNGSIFAEAVQDKVNAKGPKHGYVRKVSLEMSWVKPRLVIAVLRRGYGVLLSDLDVTWNRSPIPYLMENELDIVHQCDSAHIHSRLHRLSINSGFYMVRPNKRTLDYFVDLMSFRPDESADQNAMRLFMKYSHLYGISHRCLPKWDFSMKCNYKEPDSLKWVKGKMTFEWRPYPLHTPPKWVVMHATCLSGASDKIRYLRAINAWFLDLLDDKTGTPSSPKPFCALVPASSNGTEQKHIVVHHVFGTTPHSDHYGKMTADPTYLLRRH